MNTKKTVKNKLISLALLMMFSATTIYAADETTTSSTRIVVSANNQAITSDFEGIKAGTTDFGAALNNAGFTGVTIEGNFSYNGFTSPSSSAYIGAIYNTGGIDSITGSFTGNYSDATKTVYAGAIYNAGTIGTITGDFYYNYVSTSYSSANARDSAGGAIYNVKTITSIVGDFVGNYTVGTKGTAISAWGGAIYNKGGTIGSISGSFLGNYTSSLTEGYALGGAVYNNAAGSIGFYASSENMEFTGNFVVSAATATSNAIHNLGTIVFNASSGYSITLNDAISGSSGTIGISGEGSTIFNNTVADQTITVTNSNLVLGSYSGGYTTTDYAYAETTANYTASAASADLSNSTLNMTNSTLTFAVSNSSHDLANKIVLGSTTLTSTTLALDLSAVYGSFSLTIDCSSMTGTLSGSDLYAALNTELDVITREEASTTVSYNSTIEGYDYIVALDEQILAEFNVTYDAATSIITIAGIAVPEPSTYAMILGVLALGFAYYRRKSKQ